MADYGLKITKPGYDVAPANDEDLVFSSDLNTLIIHSSGSGSVSITAGSSSTVIISHDLGYRPVFLFYSELGSALTDLAGAFYQMPWYVPGGLPRYCIPYCDSNDLKIEYSSAFLPSGTESIDYKYVIYYNKAK